MIVFGCDREIPGVTISLSAEARERGSGRGDIRELSGKLERPREPLTEVTRAPWDSAALHDSRTLPRSAQGCSRRRGAAVGPLPRRSCPSTRSPALRTCLRGPPRARGGGRGLRGAGQDADSGRSPGSRGWRVRTRGSGRTAPLGRGLRALLETVATRGTEDAPRSARERGGGFVEAGTTRTAESGPAALGPHRGAPLRRETRELWARTTARGVREATGRARGAAPGAWMRRPGLADPDAASGRRWGAGAWEARAGGAGARRLLWAWGAMTPPRRVCSTARSGTGNSSATDGTRRGGRCAPGTCRARRASSRREVSRGGDGLASPGDPFCPARPCACARSWSPWAPPPRGPARVKAGLGQVGGERAICKGIRGPEKNEVSSSRFPNKGRRAEVGG
ncbi:uncharacterized protein LOC125107025 [Lutra lutra]|uniref:uncharacterized protein LOC125107025 n=1 Tax=Lutra lutra TaxID=9657 RepID=UPI001FCF979A|nr:uncharacterized protein LOC125107025 [Lutra lutra]